MTKDQLFVEVVNYCLTQNDQGFTFGSLTQTILEDLNEKVKIQHPNKSLSVILSNEEIMLLQEIVWDLIIQRILTPGADRYHDEWSNLRVTNKQGLLDIAAKLGISKK